MRAKFVVNEEVRSLYGITYKLNAVISGSPENEEFFRTTPTGTILVSVKAIETSARLELGKEY